MRKEKMKEAKHYLALGVILAVGLLLEWVVLMFCGE